ncbi:MAG: MerR family transcriptional regulator [Bacteroidetes bacterium]|nr:MerR family transcriptional regulator [Bacteroidota bacterium]
MLHQLDLFGGEPLQHPEKKSAREKKDKPIQVSPPSSAPQPPANIEETITAVEEPKESTYVDAAFIQVPDDEVLFSKLYYPISDVAKMFNVNISLIRFWEKEFDILKPRKNRKGDRLFRPEDVKNLKLIYFLLKEKRYTIEGAKSFLKKGKKVNEQFETIELLKNIKSMLLELKAGLS